MDFEKEAQRYPFDLSLVSFASDDQEYVVAFKDYPDIIGSGVSAEEAMAEAYDNLAVYLEYLSDEGKTIVAPRVKESGEEPSGRVTLRMSKTLHGVSFRIGFFLIIAQRRAQLCYNAQSISQRRSYRM